MGSLRRNLALAPRHTNEVAYKTLVRPQFLYYDAAPIWHPCHIKNTDSFFVFFPTFMDAKTFVTRAVIAYHENM